MTDCLFCNIRDGGIPADIIYEDDDCMAFRDINPKAPVHFLVIPRRHMENLFDATPSDEGLLGRIQLRIQQIAKEQGLDSGFRTVLNTGPGGHQRCTTCTIMSSEVVRLAALTNNIYNNRSPLWELVVSASGSY